MNSTCDVANSLTMSGAQTAGALEWSLHRARQSPMKAVGVVVVIAAVAVTSCFLMRHWVAGLFALLCLTGSTADFLFPVRFILDDRGARVKGFGIDREMKWAAVKRVACGEEWIHLSPFRIPTRLDRFRGIELRLDVTDGELKEAIIARIRKSVPGVAA